MAVLGGEFAMVLLAEGLPECVEQVEGNLKELEESSDLLTVFRYTRSPEERKIQNTLPYRVQVTSLDHPGIVFKISHLLRSEVLIFRVPIQEPRGLLSEEVRSFTWKCKSTFQLRSRSPNFARCSRSWRTMKTWILKFIRE